MTDEAQPMSDEELAMVRAVYSTARPLSDVRRLLATIDELQAMLVDINDLHGMNRVLAREHGELMAERDAECARADMAVGRLRDVRDLIQVEADFQSMDGSPALADRLRVIAQSYPMEEDS